MKGEKGEMKEENYKEKTKKKWKKKNWEKENEKKKWKNKKRKNKTKEKWKKKVFKEKEKRKEKKANESKKNEKKRENESGNKREKVKEKEMKKDEKNIENEMKKEKRSGRWLFRESENLIMICAFLQLKLFFFSSCLKICLFYLFFMFGNVKKLSGGWSVKLSLNFNNKNTTHNVKIFKFPCVIILKKNFFSDSRMCQIIFPIPNMKVSISLVCVNDLLKAYLLCLFQFTEPNLGDERNKMYRHVVHLGGGLKCGGGENTHE